jgi:hypothetical protein
MRDRDARYAYWSRGLTLSLKDCELIGGSFEERQRSPPNVFKSE